MIILITYTQLRCCREGINDVLEGVRTNYSYMRTVRLGLCFRGWALNHRSCTHPALITVWSPTPFNNTALEHAGLALLLCFLESSTLVWAALDWSAIAAPNTTLTGGERASGEHTDTTNGTLETALLHFPNRSASSFSAGTRARR